MTSHATHTFTSSGDEGTDTVSHNGKLKTLIELFFQNTTELYPYPVFNPNLRCENLTCDQVKIMSSTRHVQQIGSSSSPPKQGFGWECPSLPQVNNLHCPNIVNGLNNNAVDTVKFLNHCELRLVECATRELGLHENNWLGG